MTIRKAVSRIRWSCAFLIFAAVSLTGHLPASAACSGLKGTFLQLTDAQLARPAAEWQQLFDELRSIGINTLFLQWTVLDRKPLFQTARHETAVYTPLASILDLAARSGIHVWVGLAMDSSYWEEIKQAPELLKPYFRRRVQEMAGFLDSLNATTAGAPFDAASDDVLYYRRRAERANNLWPTSCAKSLIPLPPSPRASKLPSRTW